MKSPIKNKIFIGRRILFNWGKAPGKTVTGEKIINKTVNGEKVIGKTIAGRKITGENVNGKKVIGEKRKWSEGKLIKKSKW